MRFSFIRRDKKNDTHLTVKPAEWFFERIKTDTKAGDITRLREHIAYYGDDGTYERANPVAMVCPSVELKKTQNGNLEVTAYNDLVALHVPNLLKAEDLRAVKEAAKLLPMTLAAFVGADGRSVEVLVAVEEAGFSENGSQNEKHHANSHLKASEGEMDAFYRSAYETVLSVYGGLLPQPIERQAVSARHEFRMTLDAQPYYNPSPTPLKASALPASSASPSPASSEASSSSEVSSIEHNDFSLYTIYEQMYGQAAEEAYIATETVEKSQQKEAYLTVLMQLLCEKGVPEEEAFLHVRNHHIYKSDYDEDALRAIVTAVYAEKKPGKHGVGDMVSRETRRLIRFLTTRYVFRYNNVMGYTEYRPNNTWVQDWKPCDENTINGMTIEAKLANLDVRDKDVRRYVRSNMIRPSDPISDYMLACADKWDGKTDHIAMLARTVPCDLPQWEQWFRKWFLSMVAQWLLPNQEYGNSVVPLLISPQGDGKTSFCRNLLPKELRWGFLENIDVSEKRQTLQAMHNFLIINLDEFNQISPKTQEGFLKNVIQLPSVKLKRPYSKHVEEFRRYASFIATTNESNVLSDPTGNRRFICVQLTAPVNTAYKPNYEALYGQAYTIIMHHEEQWWFTPDETKAIVDHNRSFEVAPPALQYFNEYYDIPADDSDGEWLSATAIFDHLRRIAGSGLKASAVSTFGRHLKNIPNLRQRRTKNSIQYFVKKR